MTRARAGELALGLDFGTESVRALLVDLTGREKACAVARYRHGQITARLPSTGESLPPDFALQHPADWLDSAAIAVRRTLRQSGAPAQSVVGIGVDFTSCTLLPTLADGTSLALLPRWKREIHAWPKLWKHHGAVAATQRINRLAARRKEPWLKRYGGVVGLEWFFPKILEVLQQSPKVYDAAEVWLEAGDWLVWQLTQQPAGELARSTCQAGYKALWNAQQGYPSPRFLAALHPRLANIVREKMPGRMVAPGQSAGTLGPLMARRLGLPQGLPVSAAIIDAHAGVPGAGAADPDTLVMVMGTSSCYMINSPREKLIPGLAGVVKDGILPGYFGYETGQAAVGDAFDWLRRLVGQRHFDTLTREAAALPPGAEGVLAMDWVNGCRTPLMDGRLAGAFTGLKMHHQSAHLYRALLEASGLGLRWIVNLLQEGGVPVRRLIATGGLPHHNPLLVQIYADVLGRTIHIHPSRQGPALGAAILGALAADPQRTGFASPRAAIRAMAQPRGQSLIAVHPRRANRKAYDQLYLRYRALAEYLRQASST